MKAAVRLAFPDGTILSGDSATDVLARLGRLQWTPLEVPQMKARLSDRAWAWSRFTLDPLLPDDEFLTALDASALCMVLYGGRKAKPGLHPSPDPDDAAEDDLRALLEAVDDEEDRQ